MIQNHTGQCGIPINSPGTMDIYDALPSDVRKVMQEAPYNIALSPYKNPLCCPPAADCIKILSEHIKIMAKTTYGPDHPQAQ